jgi:hypothetical protein
MGELGGGRKVVLVVWLLRSKESKNSVGAVCVRVGKFDCAEVRALR